MKKIDCFHLSFIVAIPLVLGMASPLKMTDARVKNAVIGIEAKPNLEIHEGYLSQKEETVLIKKGRKTIARIHLGEPVIVSQADVEEPWGYYQFPNVGLMDDGTIIVEWQMLDDSEKSYGKTTKREYSPMVSKDQGLTWMPLTKSGFIYRRGNNVILDNGDYLQVNSHPAKKISEYVSFPEKVGESGHYVYYPIEQLPEDLQGIYITYRKKNRNTEFIHASLYDPGLLRYAIEGEMPIVWWGNIKQLSDQNLVSGVYPTYYLLESGEVSRGGVSFYKSNDKGYSWEVVGKIPFVYDGIADVIGSKSYDEPAFEILADSSFICVMRTGATSPLYRSFSSDKGHTWTTPEPFTPNGVKPQLFKLRNGVLVLATGRPGVQLRFCFDEKGGEWSVPIDFIPFMNEDGTVNRDVSCGYTSLIEVSDESFYIVYSDFTTKNSDGDFRKSIVSRKVSIVK